MEQKTAIYKGLEFNDAYYEDSSLTSPDYFQITEFPIRLTAGKNLFKLKGHPTNLKVGGYLNLEVLDYNLNPVYYEIIDYIEEDKSRVVAIYIYPDSSPGDCTVTLMAEAAVINNQPVPAEWQGRPNIKWSRTLAINPTVSNDSEIIFETLPVIRVREQVAAHLDRSYTGGQQFPTYSTGTVKYFAKNGQPAIELTGGTFTSDMRTGTITVTAPVNPTPNATYVPGSIQYTSAVKKILTPTTALLDSEYIVYSSQSISTHTYNQFDDSAFSLDYEATPTYTETQNSESYALVEIEGLQPATGDVSRIKMYMNNNGTVGTWESIIDVELTETEIFVNNTGSMFPDKSIGTIDSQTVINTYWTAHTYIGTVEPAAPTMTYSSADMDNSMIITSTTDISQNDAVHVVQINDAYPGLFLEKSAYKVTFDAIGTRSIYSANQNPKISVYLSGSAFDYDVTDLYNQALPKTLGKRIGIIELDSTSKRYDDQVFNFEADTTGQGTLLFVIESGEWQISDIRTTTDNDSGYTPNYTRLKALVPTAHKIDNQLTFKIEYYNVAGVKSKQLNYINNLDWEGGNRYVDGNYSMLTGSLYVADSLESGVAISGYPNSGFIRSLGYEGFDAGFAGFLLWSGSAMPSSAGTKGGVPYSGVGLELYANTDNYFRYATNPSELDVRTKTFFLGSQTAPVNFLSGSNGNIEISSSAFHLNPNGSVTASGLLVVNGPNILFDSNSEYADAVNIGRILYYSPTEISTTTGAIMGGEANGITSSIFETFLLPGETRIQFSFMAELDNFAALPAISANGVYIKHYISTGSYLANNSISVYDVYNDEIAISPATTAIGGAIGGRYSSGARNFDLTGTAIEDRQGMYCRIRSVIYIIGSSPSTTATVKFKSFVYRASRNVGGSTTAPPTPIRE